VNIRTLLGAAVLLLASGCHASSTAVPHPVIVSGIIRMPGGTPVDHAKVWIEPEASVFTDARGSYSIVLNDSRRQITVNAVDGYTPGVAYAVTSSGSVTVERRQILTNVDVVLDHATPI
jgi:hypothetical protein